MCVAARLCRKSCREAVSGAILAERSRTRLHPGSSFLSSRFLVWGGIMYVELEFQPFLINRNGSNGIPCRISCRDCDTFWAQKLDSAFEICQYLWPCNTLSIGSLKDWCSAEVEGRVWARSFRTIFGLCPLDPRSEFLSPLRSPPGWEAKINTVEIHSCESKLSYST